MAEELVIIMLAVDLVVALLIVAMACGTLSLIRTKGATPDQNLAMNATLTLKSYIVPSIVLVILLHVGLPLAALAFISYMCVCIAVLTQR